MRYFKNFALMTALTLGSAAFAQVSSTSTDYSTATSEVTASGTYQSAVSFTVPNATLTIPAAQVRPGAHFTVTIPVTNTTDRTITLADNGSTKPGNVTLSPTLGDIAAGAAGDMVYDVTFAADATGSESYGDQDVSIVFKLIATDTVATPEDLTVN